MKKGLLYLLLAAAIVGALIAPVKREISETYFCNILDTDDESFQATVRVVFTGTYYDYLVRKDRFVGRIDIPGYDFIPASASDLDLEIGRFGSYSLDHMLYFAGDELCCPGTFQATEDLDSFILRLYYPNESGVGAHGRYFLCYPEMTLDEIYACMDLAN